MVADESWSYPPSYERDGASYPVAPPGIRGIHRHRNPGCILSRTKVRSKERRSGAEATTGPIITTDLHGSIATVGQINGANTTNLFGGTNVMENTSQGVRFSTDLSLDLRALKSTVQNVLRFGNR